MASAGRVAWGRAVGRVGHAVAVAGLAWAAGWPGGARPAAADTVVLKDGNILRGTVDKDNTLVFVADELKRTIFYNSKIARIDTDAGFQDQARFQLVQPLEVHTGLMPPAAFDIVATPWDAKGRRGFQYRNQRSARVAMQQAINEISPHMTRFRGIDGYWKGQIATSEVPREVILGLLAKVDQADEKERLKVARFLIQAQWFDEARAALDQLERDFPPLKENIEGARRAVAEARARDALADADLARRAQRLAEAARLARSLTDPELPRDLLDEARDLARKDDERAAADRALADRLRDLADKLSEADRPAWRVRVAEVLFALAQAPDAARGRLEPALNPAAAPPAAATADAPALAPADEPAEARLARAMSAWVVGPEGAVASLTGAGALWDARRQVQAYLTGRALAARPDPKARPEPPPAPDAVRAAALAALLAQEQAGTLTIEALEQVVARMPPPLDEPRDDGARAVTTHRVVDDENPVPTEYAVLLPPEYHPLRSYPAVVALHDGRGPRSAVDWVATEAARRGYVVIAPEYTSPSKGKGYHYSTEEHAAVQLSLRDARKRYAIDSNRVFVAGQLAGADMALDLGLAHPDLFAGVASISGFPGKYVYKYKPQLDKVPLYIVLGELAPAAREQVFDQYARPLIEDVKDVTYVDYFKRGLEVLPEEVPAMFNWMAGRRRDPTPKSFLANTAREGDARFFGVIVQELANGRAITPEAALPLGQNIRPASIKLQSSVQGNLLNLTTQGVARLDVWASPKLIDFKRKVEVRQNERVIFKGMVKPDLALMLEDLRVRGDRQQLYYWKVSAGGPRPKGR